MSYWSSKQESRRASVLLHSAVTVAHRSCQPNTAVRPQMQWSSGATVWTKIMRGILFGKLHPIKDSRLPLSNYNFTFLKEYKAHTWFAIRLCFDNLQYRCRYTALLFAVELKRCWQQCSVLTVTQEEADVL